MLGSAETVLIIETDEATRTLYQRELARQFRVISCASEAEAEAVLHNQVIDAMVIEPVGLHDPDWGFLVRSQALSIPIVLCSSLDARRRGVEMGVAAYLVKPVMPAKLLTTLEQLLHSEYRVPANAFHDSEQL